MKHFQSILSLKKSGERFKLDLSTLKQSDVSPLQSWYMNSKGYDSKRTDVFKLSHSPLAHNQRGTLASKDLMTEQSFMLNLFEVQEMSSFDESAKSYKTYQGPNKLFVNWHEEDYPSQSVNY